MSEERDIQSRIAAFRERKIVPDLWAFGYARVSSKKQEEDRSKEDQIEDVKEYAQIRGLHLVYIFNTTESAYKEGRDGFGKMLKLAEDLKVKNMQKP